MKESSGKEDFQTNAAWQSSARAPGSLRSSLLEKSTTRSSPTRQRLSNIRATQKELKASLGKVQWFHCKEVALFLIVVMWASCGFYLQSKLTYSYEGEFVGYNSESVASESKGVSFFSFDSFRGSSSVSAVKESVLIGGDKSLGNKSAVGSKRKGREVSSFRVSDMQNQTIEFDERLIARWNSSYGLFVGPFDRTEENILGLSADKRRGTCQKKGEFARLVQSRSFMLILHELSMTGAPISMMELATEILSCGGKVSLVYLSKKGGLMEELRLRGIYVLNDRAELSYKAAMKADFVIPGSAVCSAWVEKYLEYYPAGWSQILWWIMENRMKYFERSKHLLNQVQMLIFLSLSQAKQWMAWGEQQDIKFSQQMIVPLSVHDELAFVAGIPCSLNTPEISAKQMLEKRELLRSIVRKEMGLSDNDMLVMALSSINPGKGQRLLLESALLVAENNVPIEDLKINGTMLKESSDASLQNSTLLSNCSVSSNKSMKKWLRIESILSMDNHTRSLIPKVQQTLRMLNGKTECRRDQTLKVLIGSVGSKSNKAFYMDTMLRLLSEHPNLSKYLLWTPATTCVAPLYAAADVYVINTQGPGETFGRVTIEAMAFGLPVLGTDAAGTQEIVKHGVTGLLHPLGKRGTKTLAENIQFLLQNPSARKKMGMQGRLEVHDKYLKHQTYEKFARVLKQSMISKEVLQKYRGG